jgi:hypothetical protein
MRARGVMRNRLEQNIAHDGCDGIQGERDQSIIVLT